MGALNEERIGQNGIKIYGRIGSRGGEYGVQMRWCRIRIWRKMSISKLKQKIRMNHSQLLNFTICVRFCNDTVQHGKVWSGLATAVSRLATMTQITTYFKLKHVNKSGVRAVQNIGIYAFGISRPSNVNLFGGKVMHVTWGSLYHVFLLCTLYTCL